MAAFRMPPGIYPAPPPIPDEEELSPPPDEVARMVHARREIPEDGTFASLFEAAE